MDVPLSQFPFAVSCDHVTYIIGVTLIDCITPRRGRPLFSSFLIETRASHATFKLLLLHPLPACNALWSILRRALVSCHTFVWEQESPAQKKRVFRQLCPSVMLLNHVKLIVWFYRPTICCMVESYLPRQPIPSSSREVFTQPASPKLGSAG